jgi:type III secretion control protein HpaP
MTGSRVRRIIPGELAAQRRDDDARAPSFDYSALARRARQRRASIAPACADDEPAAGGAARDTLQPFHWREASSPNARSDAAADADDEAAASQRDAVIRQVSNASVPVVDALFRTQDHFLELARSLANEVAAFCADPAVGGAGNWDVQMPLDRSILPDTTLYLALSPFQLSLRFDTSSIEVKTLLLHHSTMLERELDSLLRAWSTPRDIELMVW